MWERPNFYHNFPANDNGQLFLYYWIFLKSKARNMTKINIIRLLAQTRGKSRDIIMIVGFVNFKN